MRQVRTLGDVILIFVTLLASVLCGFLGVVSAQDNDWRVLEGEWIYVEDRTQGRAVEAQQPSMGARVKLRVEADAIVLERSDGPVRMALDGSPTRVERENGSSVYSGRWQDGAFQYEVELLKASDNSRTALIQIVLRVTDEGLIAANALNPPDGFKSVALYRHPDNIALPAPAQATTGDLAWLSGAWVGTRGTGGTTSIEERWSPPLGGSMLAVSRTVTRGKLRAFEYLRVVERDGGLVYIAQPGGGKPTEFVLTEITKGRAVFENPRHDSPQRIVYELSAEGRLVASIGYAKGGRPQRFEFSRE